MNAKQNKPKSTTPRHIIIKLLQPKMEKKPWKQLKENNIWHTGKQRFIKGNADFLSDNLEVRQWNIFKVLKEKKQQHKILCPEISFKNEC